MTQTTNRRAAAAALLAFCALAACRAIPLADKNIVRREVEVAIELTPGFTQALAVADDDLRRAIGAVVVDEADVGLRFYPVLATDYAADQARPDYLLQVRLDGMQVVVAGGDTGGADVDRVRTAVSAALYRRRPSAPALLVARAADTATTHQPSAPPSPAPGAVEAAYSVAGHPNGVNVRQEVVVDAVRVALRRALRSMLPAIEREW